MEWAAEETGVSAELIRAAAREFASHRPATIIHPGRRVNWYGDDTQRSRAIALLTGLLGSWGRNGGLFVAAGMKIAPYPLPEVPEVGPAAADGADAVQYPFADEGITTSIRDATLSRQALPDQELVRLFDQPDAGPAEPAGDAEGHRPARPAGGVRHRCPSEIAGYADVILPDTTFLERHDELLVGYGRTGWTSLRQPVVAAPHDQKPAWWIAKQLADKLGIGASMPFKDMEEYLSYRIEKSGHSWQALKKDGVIMGPPQPITVEERARTEVRHARRARWSSGPSSWPRPVSTRCPSTPGIPQAPEGHFRLITGRAPVHTFSRTQSNPLLHDLMAENEVWVNTATAARLGLKQREYVRLKNQDGVVSNRIRVKATQRIREDCVYMVYGFGHTNPMLKTRLPAGRQRGRAEHALRHRPADGQHQHPRQFRHFREGGLRCPALEWSSTRASAWAAWTAWSPARPRTTCRSGFCRDWITTEVRGTFPDLTHGDPLRALQPLRQPALRECCPTGASHVEDFGKTVQVTANKCIGCKACIAACPYDARFVHPEGYVDKCSFCIHRVKDGLDPACVSVCPTHCMHFGDLDDPKSAVNQLLRTRKRPHAAARGRHPAAHLLSDAEEQPSCSKSPPPDTTP